MINKDREITVGDVEGIKNTYKKFEMDQDVNMLRYNQMNHNLIRQKRILDGQQKQFKNHLKLQQ